MDNTSRLQAFNKADKMVCFLAVVFLLTLVLKCKFKDVLVLEWLYFCSEAALVGGIADWFAVTALFKRPLGFSFHTDLINSNKEGLAKGFAVLVQNELLDKDSLQEKIQSIDLTSTVLAKLNEPQVQDNLKKILVDYAEKKLQSLDTDVIAGNLEKIIYEQIIALNFVDKATSWVQETFQNGLNEKIYGIIIDKLYAFVEGKTIRNFIHHEIEQRVDAYMDEHLLGKMLGGILRHGNKPILDIAELTDAVVTELAKTVTSMQNDVTIKTWFLQQLDSAVQNVLTDAQWEKFLLNLQQDALQGLSLKIKIKQLLDDVIVSACRPNDSEVNELVVPSILTKAVDSGMVVILNTLNTSPVYQQRLEIFLQKTALAGVTIAHSTLGDFIETILANMPTSQLNNLIYSKVEDDMLWIRFNGSIVGAIIGCMAFGILQVVK